jgi:hypothetical protein
MRLRSHTMGFTAEAIAGLDIALWDLLGKYRQEPVWRLLGGADRQTLPVYSSGIPGDTSEKQVQQLEGILARSFTTAKCGSGSLQMQMDLIRPLSKAMSDRGTLLYDAHGAFDLNDAIRFAHFLQELGNVEWFEDALIPEDASGYARSAHRDGRDRVQPLHRPRSPADPPMRHTPTRRLPRRRHLRDPAHRTTRRHLRLTLGPARQYLDTAAPGRRPAPGRRHPQLPGLRISDQF